MLSVVLLYDELRARLVYSSSGSFFACWLCDPFGQQIGSCEWHRFGLYKRLSNPTVGKVLHGQLSLWRHKQCEWLCWKFQLGVERELSDLYGTSSWEFGKRIAILFTVVKYYTQKNLLIGLLKQDSSTEFLAANSLAQESCARSSVTGRLTQSTRWTRVLPSPAVGMSLKNVCGLGPDRSLLICHLSANFVPGHNLFNR